jgi:hypothetical protein
MRSKDPGPFYVGTHRFEKNLSGEIRVDKAVFDFEEAQQIGQMLLSQNPFLKLSAQFAVWEKNGTLLKLVLVGTILLLVVVIVVIRR